MVGHRRTTTLQASSGLVPGRQRPTVRVAPPKRSPNRNKVPSEQTVGVELPLDVERLDGSELLAPLLAGALRTVDARLPHRR